MERSRGVRGHFRALPQIRRSPGAFRAAAGPPGSGPSLALFCSRERSEMKKKMLLLAAIVALALPAASTVAAPRGGQHSGRGGFHGGFRSGFRPYYGYYGGPYWAYRWGWYGWPAYYGYYGYYRGPSGYIGANWASVKTDVDPEEAPRYLVRKKKRHAGGAARRGTRGGHLS